MLFPGVPGGPGGPGGPAAPVFDPSLSIEYTSAIIAKIIPTPERASTVKNLAFCIMSDDRDESGMDSGELLVVNTPVNGFLFNEEKPKEKKKPGFDSKSKKAVARAKIDTRGRRVPKRVTTSSSAQKGDVRILGQGSYGVVVDDNGQATKNYHDFPSFLRETVAYISVQDCSRVSSWTRLAYDQRQLGFVKCDSNLHVYIRTRRITYGNEELNILLYDVLQGLQQIHSLGVVHADIKMTNIMVKGGRAYLADLGISGPYRYAKIDCTSKPIAEGNRGVVADTAFDMFSFGCLLLRIVHRWMEKNPSSAYLLPHVARIPSESWRTVAENCLIEDRNERWTAVKCLQYLNVRIEKVERPVLPAYEVSQRVVAKLQDRRIHRVELVAQAYAYLLDKRAPRDEEQEEYFDALCVIAISCLSHSDTVIKYLQKHPIPSRKIMENIFRHPTIIRYIFLF